VNIKIWDPYLIQNREKKKANGGFDLLSTIHDPEYSEMMKKCPKLPDGTPFEPSQKFEVTLEPASLTAEK
jgi:hypothetical protein